MSSRISSEEVAEARAGLRRALLAEGVGIVPEDEKAIRSALVFLRAASSARSNAADAA